MLVYYRGSNDAWDGYGGAVVYTPKPKLDPKYFDELDAALRPVGLRFDQFELGTTVTHILIEEEPATDFGIEVRYYVRSAISLGLQVNTADEEEGYSIGVRVDF